MPSCDHHQRNAALVHLWKAGNKAAAGKLFVANIAAVGKSFNRKYERDFLDAQAFIILCKALETFDPAKGANIVTHWINRCRFDLMHDWDNETHLIRYPSKPVHPRDERILPYEDAIPEIDGDYPHWSENGRDED